MRKNLRRQTYGNAFRTLCQQQWELDRERDGFFVAPIVRQLPFGGLGVENRIEGKLRKAGLYVTGCSSPIACQNVAPVALRVNEQVFLSQLHQGVTDRGIAMRMKLHRFAHHVCHFIVAAIVHPLHGVKDAALHRFQAILDIRHGTLENDITGIVEKPVLVHAREVVYSRCVKPVGRFVIGVLFRFRHLQKVVVPAVVFVHC